MVISFNDEVVSDVVGNKAKFLIDMKKYGFNIPNGIVLDKDVYNSFIKFNKIDKKINKLLMDVSLDNVTSVSSNIMNLFSSSLFSDSVRNDVLERLSDDKKYAVRSSGIKEDLDNYSFAGQYDTFLNISKDGVVSKIIDCYKSMFSVTILSYFINHNISFDNLGMAVIVQEMVDSDYSGICFTINPLTGNDKEMLIEVGKGLGEGIVSGRVNPEQYYYDWYSEKFRYKKKNKLLSNSMLEKISDVFLDIQLFFGYPCDIEFAIFNDELYILQARKITKINYSKITDMWSTADFKDGGVSSSICTPYMWSLYEYIWEYTLRKFILDSKILKESDLNRKLGDMFFARCYWNLSVVKNAMSNVVGYKEREFDSEYGVKITYEGDGKTTKVNFKSIVAIVRMALAQRKILKTRNEFAEEYKSELLDIYNIYRREYDNDLIDDIKKSWYMLTHDDYMKSESTYFWQIFINTVHQSLYKDGLLKYVSESDYLTLLCSIDDISHLLPFYGMWDISREIRKDKRSFNYWKNSSLDKIVFDIQNDLDDVIFVDIKELIKMYGYHSDKELDVTYPCYYEDIRPIVGNIKDMVLLEDKFSPELDKKNGRNKYKKILDNIKKNVSKRQYKKIETKISKMRKMLWWREEFRDISTRFYYIIRVYTLKLANVFVRENVIDEVDDIWYLKVSDIWDYLDGKKSSSVLKNIISKNKIYYNSYRNYMSDNEIGSIFNGENEKKYNSLIKGLGANNGRVTGIARVIENFDEIDRLEKNDILVTRFTDTGWTSKFAILSGIVTEYGGILCHAAIVSREYGIPAVVSCHDVCSKIKDGQKITIDGATGVVTIEE